jgi:hypothetical protein
MKTKLTFITFTLLCAGFAGASGTPQGWFKAGSHPKEYLMEVDQDTVRSGKASAHLRCLVTDPKGFGTLMQSFNAEDYRGKRIRLTGYVKADDAEGGGFWMRVDGPAGKLLAFDNMSKRPIEGTRDWKSYAIVLDVPDTSESINLGLMAKYGQLWMDDLKIEVVDNTVPVTDLNIGKESGQRAPVNLDFEIAK